MKKYLVFGVLAIASAGRGETVYLKNGTVLQGAIVEMSETNITLSTSDLGTIIIKRRSVASISDGQYARHGTALPQANVPQPAPPKSAPVPPSPLQAAAPSAVPIQQDITINNGKVSGTSSTNSALAAASDRGHLHSNLAVGYSGVRIGNDRLRMSSIHWDVLSFRTPSGSSFGLFASAGRGDDGSFSTGGIKSDWALTRTRFAQGASSLSFGLHGGVSQVVYKEAWSFPYYPMYYDQEVKAHGPSFGGQLAYNFLSDHDFGFQVGISATRVFDDDREIDLASGFGGISIVF